MIQEALAYVFEHAHEAAEREFQKDKHVVRNDIPTDGRTVVLEAGGELTDWPVPPALRRHTVHSVEDMIMAARLWGPGVLWIDVRQITLVCDDADRRETVTMRPALGDVFTHLMGLPKAYAQPDLIRALRTVYAKSAGVEVLLPTIRKIKFRQMEAGHADIQHGRESMGRQIESEVTGFDEATFPEQLVVPTNVFANPGEREFVFPVTLNVEVDVSKQRFVLSPLPDALNETLDEALAGIQERLAMGLADSSPKTPILRGTP